MRSRLPLVLVGLSIVSAAGAAIAARRTEELVSVQRQDSEAAATAPASAAVHAGEREYVGVIVPAATLELAAPLDGRVVRVTVALGDEVAAGAVVALLDDRTLRQELAIARAQLQVLDAEAEIAATELAEAADVANRRVATVRASAAALSNEQLGHALFARQRAEHAIDAARAKVGEQRARIAVLEQKVADTRVRAPFPASVAARHVDPGAFVSRGTPIAKLVAASAARVRFGVPVDRWDALAIGTPIVVRMERLAAPVTAYVDHIAPALDASARLVFAEAELAGPSFGRLGRPARVSLLR